MSITLLRHGETKHQGAFYGSSHNPLTDNGWQQMVLSATQISFRAIVTSPLPRCAVFAQHLADQTSTSCITLPALQEYHFGKWEKQSLADLHQHFPSELSLFWQDPRDFTPPQAEPFFDFCTRVEQATEQLQRLHEQYQQLLVITHAGVIRTFTLLSGQHQPNTWLNYPVDYASLHHYCPISKQVTPYE